jgi:ribosomal protein L11 methyltransferase
LTVTGLFAGDADDLLIEALLCQRVAALQTVQRKHLADQDWERAWMDRFGPMRFGDRLWICPSTMEPPAQSQVVVTLDPGLAFGTGTHATTALCLEALDTIDLGGASVLDYGCGSGVLAIAAIKLGALRAVGVDIDPQAWIATGDNADLNGVSDRVEMMQPDDLEEGVFDVLVANILAGPLIDLANSLCQLVRPGGQLILSGILAEQREMVENAYRSQCGVIDFIERDGWICLRTHRSN